LQYFIGESFLKPLTDVQNGEYPIFNVTFEPGKVIVIPANVKHWHGAKADSWFSHVTFEPGGTDTSNEWLKEKRVLQRK
jgi:quercetin dioxygenase-like cupin family protein